MIIAVYIILAIVIYYIGYILSLFSSVAYVDPEKIENVAERLSGFRKRYLDEITENPRISLQLSIVFKSILLVLLTLLTILLVNSLIDSLGIGADVGYIIGLAVVWLLYLVFMEILPRRQVLRIGDRDIVKYLPFYVSIYMIFKPLVRLYARLFVRRKIMRIPEDQKEDIIERAIETLAEQAGVTETIVEEDEKEMIGQIFQLDVTEVREVMVPRINIRGIEKKSDLDDIRTLTKEFGFSRYPVFDDTVDKIVGVLYVKDLFTGHPSEKESFDVTQHMREPYFVSEKKIISDLLAEFKTNKVHIAIVVDEYGGTSGLVTLEDILEEIVGEIEDEHDFETSPLIRLPDNSVRVDAGLSIEELIDEFNLEYETEEFETVGGMIYDLVGSVPAIGTHVKWKDILFEVEKVEGQRIVSVKAWVKKDTEH